MRSVFRLGPANPTARLLREVGRLGPPAATQMTLALDPLMFGLVVPGSGDGRGAMRRHDPRLLLLAIYSTVIGMVTEVEVLRALGEEPTARSLVRRRTDTLRLLRSALLIEPAMTLRHQHRQRLLTRSLGNLFPGGGLGV